MRRRLWTLLAVLTCVSGEYLMGGHLDNNAGTKSRSSKIESLAASTRKTRLDGLDLDLVAEESTVAAVAVAAKSAVLSDDDVDGDDDGNDDGVPRYRIPYPFAFNGGKPFSLEKDPVTGEIDFEKAPPVKALNYTDRYREGDENADAGGEEQERTKSKDHDDVGPNEVNTPNIYDFLNLPVRYASDKYRNDNYPLISSSYANTKVQSGANSYSTYNHRPYHLDNAVLNTHVVRPTKSPYSMTKTSTHKTTAADLKTRRTNPPTTPAPPTTTKMRIASSTVIVPSKAPVITTWKPPSTPVAFHSIDRTSIEAENEKNLLPIEKLHASGHAGSHKNPDVPTRTPSDGATEKTQVGSRYKDQANLNVVLSQARPETKPPAQNEEYKDSYDAYESSDSEGEVEGEGNGEDDGESDGDEFDYFLSLREWLRKNVTSASSTTTSRPTTSTTTTTTTTTTAATSTTITTTAATSSTTSGTTTSTGTTVAPSRPTAPPALQENVYASRPLQYPAMPQHPVVSSSNNDRRQEVVEYHDGVISHVYRPGPMIKPEPDRLGAGVPIESTSNIVIPPDQDTVSFVLGNRQNVDGGYYSVGTAVGENPYGTLPDANTFWPPRNEPHGPVMEARPERPPILVAKPSADRVTQKWPLPASSALKISNELDPTRHPQMPAAAAAVDATVHDTKGGKDPNFVIFPEDETKRKDATTTEEHIVVINEADGSVHELPPKTTTATATATVAVMAADKTKPNLPTPNISGDLPAQDLIPPAESTRPPSYYYHYQYDASRPDHPALRPPRLPPPPPRKPHHPGLPPPLDAAGLRKRPYPPDAKLPNILPQFRPNAKASHGHRGPDVIGTMPAGQGAPARIRQPPSHPPSPSSSRRPIVQAPPYLQRLNPPPPPIHAIRLAFVPTSKVDGVVLPHETEPTIRRVRPPAGAPPITHGNPEENALPNRLYAHASAALPEERNNVGEYANGENRKEDRLKSELEHESSERYPEEPPMTPPRPPLFPKRRTADPPRVATLQMIQHHGELGGEGDGDGIAATAEEEAVLAHEAERRKSDGHDPAGLTAEQPVYVVYPVNTAVNILSDDSNEKDGSVVVGTRGPQRPLPPDTLLQDDREETHTVYNGKPVAVDFPYPLERPDPSSVFPVAGVKETPVLVPSEQRQQASAAAAAAAAAASEREKNEQDAVNVIPYLQDFLPYRKKNDAAISVTLHRATPGATSTGAPTPSTPASTATPIAYVYTPTHAAHRPDYDDDDDNGAEQTVLLPSQQPSSSSSSAPAPQNFMAPFVASMSAEAPGKHGWSVVVVDPPAGAERKSDGDVDGAGNPEADTQTERNDFDLENFKPQLFGGFKPIYEFPMEDAERHDVADANTEMNMPRRAKELLLLPAPKDKDS